MIIKSFILIVFFCPTVAMFGFGDHVRHWSKAQIHDIGRTLHIATHQHYYHKR